MSEYARLGIALALLLGIAGSFALYLSWPLLTGTTVVLATAPVDPFDLLRGQYLTIRYEISSIPAIQGAQPGDAVYVTLQEGGDGVWRYQGAALSKPANGVFIQGRVVSLRGKNMNVEYGIEQYFFERGAELPRGNLTVEAKLSSSGRARISQLLVDGKPAEIAYREAD